MRTGTDGNGSAFLSLKEAVSEHICTTLPPRSPNFSVPSTAMFSPRRRRDMSVLIQENDSDEVKLLKERLIIMASEEIQILKHPDENDATIQSAKTNFRIEFEGIIACLDLNWDDWENDYLHPNANSSFPDEACRKVLALQQSLISLRVRDEELGERIRKLNRYSAVMDKRGRALGREVRELLSAAKIASFQQASYERNTQRDTLENAEGIWEGGKAEEFDFGFGER